MSENFVTDLWKEEPAILQGEKAGSLPADSLFEGLECSVELRPDDALTGLQFRDCQIDYVHCPNRRCIKKMV